MCNGHRVQAGQESSEYYRKNLRKVISDVRVKFAKVVEVKVVAEGGSRRQWWHLPAFWMMHFHNLDRQVQPGLALSARDQ